MRERQRQRKLHDSSAVVLDDKKGGPYNMNDNAYKYSSLNQEEQQKGDRNKAISAKSNNSEEVVEEIVPLSVQQNGNKNNDISCKKKHVLSKYLGNILLKYDFLPTFWVFLAY